MQLAVTPLWMLLINDDFVFHLFDIPWPLKAEKLKNDLLFILLGTYVTLGWI